MHDLGFAKPFHLDQLAEFGNEASDPIGITDEFGIAVVDVNRRSDPPRFLPGSASHDLFPGGIRSVRKVAMALAQGGPAFRIFVIGLFVGLVVEVGAPSILTSLAFPKPLMTGRLFLVPDFQRLADVSPAQRASGFFPSFLLAHLMPFRLPC